jgi:OFA family oxalate/formate antiporter-like MFS transporter
MLCLFYGVMSGIGTGFAYVTPVATVVKWFPHRKGLMGGIVIFGFGIGAFLFSPAVRYLIKEFDWQTSFIGLGCVFLVLGSILARFIQPPEAGQVSDGGAAKSVQRAKDLTPREVIKTRRFWLAWSVCFLVLIVGVGLMGHIVSHALESGISPMSAALVLSVVAIFNGLGRVTSGGVSDIIGRANTLSIAAFMMMVAAVGLMFIQNNLILLYTLGGVFGLAFGACLVLYPVLATELFGEKHMGANYGILFSSYGIGGFLGPMLFGAMHDGHGDYQSVLMLSFVLCCVGGCLALALSRVEHQLKCQAQNASPKTLTASKSAYKCLS